MPVLDAVRQHPWFRPDETRAAGRFSANEVREILSRTKMVDFRQLGCPDWIFQKTLENRAKKINFRSSEPSSPVNDLSEKLQRIALF